MESNGGHTAVRLHHHKSVPGAPRCVAIAGATGHLGSHFVKAFLSPPFCDSFSELVLLSRQQVTPPTPPPGVNTKVTTRQYKLEHQGSIIQALDGVDVLVSAVNHHARLFKEHLLQAIPRTDVQFYFPSEFGVDHYDHKFRHLVWGEKREHMAHVRDRIPSVATCRVFCGLFLEDAIGPWFGFDTKHGRYESIGASSTKVSYTSIADVGRVVASLAAFPKERLPRVVHTAGDSRSMKEIAAIMGEHGGGPIEVTEQPFSEYHDTTISEQSPDPAPYIRFLMGEGKINHTESGLGCENDIVNSGGKFWKWKTMEDLAKETRGKPWGDWEWPPKK